jgi:hypothetical protein
MGSTHTTVYYDVLSTRLDRAIIIIHWLLSLLERELQAGRGFRKRAGGGRGRVGSLVAVEREIRN